MKQTDRQLFDLSIWTIVKFFAIVLVLIALYFLRDIFFILFVAFVVASALKPGVDWLVRWKIPRALSVLLFYFLFIGFLILIVKEIIPLLLVQIKELLNNFPIYYRYLEKILILITDYSNQFGGINVLSGSALQTLDEFSFTAGSFWPAISGFFGGVASFVVMLVLTFYMLIEESAVKKFTKNFLPAKYYDVLSDLIEKIQIKISSWAKGQVSLSFIIFALVYLSLSILGVKYALLFALLAFMGEFIPYVGPLLASLPAIFVAFVESPLKGLFVILIFVLIQQAENHVLVPKIMQRAIGLNPLIIIVALLIGAKTAGVAGVILAIPVATVISVVMNEFYLSKE